MKCPKCGQESQTAEYLETDSGLKSAEVCVNEECVYDRLVIGYQYQTDNTLVEQVLRFMQREDRNGTWLEWLLEINRGETEFDAPYVIGVLKEWYQESRLDKYLLMLRKVASISPT